MSTTLIIVIVLVLLFVAYMVVSVRRMKNLSNVPQSEKIITLTDKNLQQQLKSGLVLVDFWAEWCMPCKVMGPILNDVAESAGGQAKVAKLNVDHYPAVSSKYGVRNIPTLVLFKNGKEVERFVGIKQKDFLLKQLQKH